MGDRHVEQRRADLVEGADKATLAWQHMLFTHSWLGGQEYTAQVQRFTAANPHFARYREALTIAPHTLPLPVLRELLDAGLRYAWTGRRLPPRGHQAPSRSARRPTPGHAH